MFSLGFWYSDEDCDSPGWCIEDVTNDIGEAYENLIFARENSASGLEHWDGARLMVLTQTDTGYTWDPLEESQYTE